MRLIPGTTWPDICSESEGTASVAGEIKPLAHWRKLDEVAAGSGVEVAPPTYEEFVAALSAAEPRRFFLVRVDECAPFPARALRDRPWDISALVE